MDRLVAKPIVGLRGVFERVSASTDSVAAMHRRFRSIALLGLLGATALAASGCTSLIWSPEGARVIDATEQLVDDVVDGREPALLCADADVEMGDPADWQGLSAGEPERFTGRYWKERAALDPQWHINLQGLPDGAEPGDRIPGDVFYRVDDAGVCVIDVAWSTLESIG